MIVDRNSESFFSYVSYKARFRFIDVGKPGDLVILAGMGRSGTTWAADIINYKKNYRILFEPFLATRVKEAEGFEYIQYLNPGERNTTLADKAKGILAGKVGGKWVDLDNKWLFYRHRIIKDIRCNLMLGWLKRIASNPPIVLMIRHPLQVVSSWHRLGWDKEADGSRSDLEVVMSQESLLKDFPIIGDVWELIDPENFVERTVFLWCIYHYVPMNQLKKNEAYPLFYENLLTKPDREVDRLFSYLKITKYNHHDLQKAFKKSSGTNYLKRNYDNDAPHILNGWKETFSPKQIERSNVILSAFGLDRVYDESGLPAESEIFTGGEARKNASGSNLSVVNATMGNNVNRFKNNKSFGDDD